MKNPLNARPEKKLEPDLTSTLDVVFLLLIFFVCTSSFKAPEKLLPTNLGGSGAIKVDAPQTQKERDLGRIVVRLVATESGVERVVNGSRVESLDEVERALVALSEIDPDVPAIVDPDREVPLESVLDVYDAARRAGLATIKFAASPEALAR
ncbi:MAG: biopolymer transporter ExbD [Thermoguttaceae bacterium]|nr:biopolymer transporter ExbD [Thermoguttaceae bacterium]